MASNSVTFELKDGVNRVEIAVQESDKNLVMESSHTTSDPAEIAALDACDGVKRGVKADKPKDGDAK